MKGMASVLAAIKVSKYSEGVLGSLASQSKRSETSKNFNGFYRQKQIVNLGDHTLMLTGLEGLQKCKLPYDPLSNFPCAIYLPGFCNLCLCSVEKLLPSKTRSWVCPVLNLAWICIAESRSRSLCYCKAYVQDQYRLSECLHRGITQRRCM